MHAIHCPSCAARYNVPAEKLGKRVKCAKCGVRFELALPAEFDELGFPELPAPQSAAQVAAAASAFAISSAPVRRGYVDDRPPAGGLNAYFRDVLGFFRMLSHPSDAATMFVLILVCLLQVLTRFAGFMGMSATAFIRGWFLSFLLRTVQGGAARDDGLPDFSLSEGVVEDVVKPSLQFIAVRLVASLPLLGALIYAARDGRIEAEVAILFGVFGVFAPELALLSALTLAGQIDGLLTVVIPPLLIGLAATPMLLLVVALEGIESLMRIDLMLITIMKTLPGYLAATVIYFGAILVPVGVAFAFETALANSTAAMQPAAPAKGAPATAPSNAPSNAPPNVPPGLIAVLADPNAANDPNAAAAATASPVPTAPGTVSPRGSGSLSQQFFGSLVGDAIGILLNVITSVFAMRAIGLYYAHFKEGFAFAWG